MLHLAVYVVPRGLVRNEKSNTFLDLFEIQKVLTKVEYQ